MKITLRLYKEMKYLEKVAIKTEHYYNPYNKIKTKLDEDIYGTAIVVNIDNKFVSSIIVDSAYLRYAISNVKENKGFVYEKDGTIYGKIIRIEPTIEECVYVAFLEGDSTYVNQLDIPFMEYKIDELNKLAKHKYTIDEVREKTKEVLRNTVEYELNKEKEYWREEIKEVLRNKVEYELNKEISKYGNLFICNKKSLNKMKDNVLKNVFVRYKITS